MALKWAELRKLSDEELVARHDQRAPHTEEPVGQFRDELRHRQEDRRLRVMIWLTVAITILTLANVVLVAVSVE